MVYRLYNAKNASTVVPQGGYHTQVEFEEIAIQVDCSPLVDSNQIIYVCAFIKNAGEVGFLWHFTLVERLRVCQPPQRR